MERGYKFRAYPNNAQKEILQKTFGCKRRIFNEFLNIQMKRFGQGEKLLSYNQCSKELTAMKKENEWLKEPDKFALQNALKDLADDYRRFFEKQKEQKYSNKKIAYLKKKNQEPTIYDLYGHPKFKLKKNRRQSYRTNFTKENIKFLGKYIQLPKLGKVSVRGGNKYLRIKGKILNATVSQEPDGKYYISLCIDVEPIDYIESTGKSIELVLDNGFVETSDGNKFPKTDFTEKSQKRMSFLQRSLARKTIGSKRWEKNRVKVARLYKKISNQRRDYIHKLSSEVIKRYDVITVNGDNDPSWSEFIEKIRYKSLWYKKKFLQKT